MSHVCLSLMRQLLWIETVRQALLGFVSRTHPLRQTVRHANTFRFMGLWVLSHCLTHRQGGRHLFSVARLTHPSFVWLAHDLHGRVDPPRRKGGPAITTYASPSTKPKIVETVFVLFPPIPLFVLDRCIPSGTEYPIPQ